DKRLVLGYVKQSEVHNRILEEERCWREYRNCKRNRGKRYSRKSSKSSPPPLHSRSDSAEREWRRERKRKLEENSRITASAAAPTTALDFWRQVVRCSGDTDGRWGHDGFKELEKPGPPVPLSIDVQLRPSNNAISTKLPLLVCKSHSPLAKTSASSSSSSSSSRVSERTHKRRKQGKKTKSRKEKRKKMKRRTKKKKKRVCDPSCSSSCLSSDSDLDVEWVEKKP
ncbi:hypothetical protein TSMEX_010894, partial [Taenia solium]